MPTDDKKKPSDLDDLRARLGLGVPAPKKPAEPARTPAAPPAGDRLGAEASARVSEEPGRPRVGKPMGRMPSTDYSSAVSVFEEPVAGEGEPEPVITGSHKLIDIGLAAPMSPVTRAAIWGVVVVAVIGALVLGFTSGKVMRDREVSNEIVDSSNQMLRQVEPVARQVEQFNQALSQYQDMYSAELQQVFVDFCGASQQPMLTARHLSDARALLTTGEQVTTNLLEYALQTQVLVAICRQHLTKTMADMSAIGRLVREAEDTRSYAVTFELGEISEGWNNFIEDPETQIYMPPQGYVVSYDDLDMVTEGEGDETAWFYEVVFSNVQRRVPIYNMVTIPREALLENAGEETALTRYIGRVQAIRSHVQSLIQIQRMLVEGLTELGEGGHRFTL